VSRLPEDALVVPSILAADATRLREQVLDVVDAGARAIHVDVMDGRFVAPNGFRPETVEMLRDALDGRDVLLDVHLMVEWPERWVASFAGAGADLITIHVEARSDLSATIDAIHEAGCLAGAAIAPSTPTWVLDAIAEDLDLALCMTVEPGYGGQEFIDASYARISSLTSLLGSGTRIEVDGGIDRFTAPVCALSGAHLLVAGSAVFHADEPGEAFVELTHLVTRELV
jgi:ribulose-phosphate 3-epimerase